MSGEVATKRSIQDIIPNDRNSSRHTKEKIAEVVATYYVTGSGLETAKRTGVPDTTISDWRRTEWWEEATVVVRDEKSQELDSMLTGLIHKAVETSAERLENGDHKISRGKEGVEVVRVPVSARDAIMVGAIAYDKRQIGRALPTSITEDSGRLATLMSQLKQIAAANNAKTIEGEVVNPGPDSDKT